MFPPSCSPASPGLRRNSSRLDTPPHDSSRASPCLHPSMASHASSSSSSSSSGAPAATLSDEDLDRRLQQRLAKLSESAPIHLSLPPPSAEQLEERLRRLEASSSNQIQTHSDEAELHRRFQKLNGQAVAASSNVAASSSSSSSSPALYSNRDIQLAGHGAGQADSERPVERVQR